MMQGWKTWLAVLGFWIIGIVYFIQGATEEGVKYILTGIGVLGIGHKIEKSGK